MKTNRVFLDTNVILDFLDKKRVNHEKAKSVFIHIAMHDLKIVISEDMMSTIYYIEKNRERVLEFYKNIVLRNWLVVPFGVDVIEKSIDASLKDGGDLEDILQCFCAIKHNCFCLITNDNGFFECGGIKVYKTETLILEELR